MHEIATKKDFDYSVVETKTASKLRALSNQLDGIYQNYQVEVGGVLFQVMADGTILDDITGYIIPDDSPVYDIFRKINEERLEAIS